MPAKTKFKYLDPDVFDPEDYESPEDFTGDEAEELWDEAAGASFAELPADGTKCEECSQPWNECTCKGGATYDSDVFFNREDAAEIAGLFLAAWEYSLNLPADELPVIDDSTDIWHAVTILVKDLDALPKKYRADIVKVKAFLDERAAEAKQDSEGEGED